MRDRLSISQDVAKSSDLFKVVLYKLNSLYYLRQKTYHQRVAMEIFSQAQPRRKILYSMVLKTICAYIMQHHGHCHKMRTTIGQLMKLKFFICKNNTLIEEEKQDFSSHCFLCKSHINNKLLMILHFELVHNEDFEVQKYEIDKKGLVISIRERKQPPESYFVQNEYLDMILLKSDEERMAAILGNIFKKFTKKQKKERKRVYYHSYDIFQRVGSSSQDIDSQQEAFNLEKDFQLCRIAELTDVNENDKNIFRFWNELIAEKTCYQTVFDCKQMAKLLSEFIVKCKKVGITREGYLTHCWTLWSHGKVKDTAIISCLKQFDEYKPQLSQLE